MRVPLPAAMITTLRSMQLSRLETSIISRPPGWLRALLAVLLLGALCGCTSVRLVYGNGQQLSWWWIDGYVDFSSEQAPAAKAAIDRLFDWHRATQLPDYADLLVTAQVQILEPTNAQQACIWQERIRDKLEPTLQRALQEAAALLPGLGETQFKAIEKRYAKGNDEMRGDFLQLDLAVRQKESVARALERAERLYGSLGEVQKRVVAEGVANSPFDPELWLRERQRQQREVLQTLRRLVADKADAEQRLAGLRNLVAHFERSPDVAYRSYQVKLAAYNCSFAAQLHNATTPAQRRKARATLKAWEDDARALAVPG